MSHTYAAFGLSIRSNRRLERLRGRETSQVDVDIEFAEGRPPEVDPEAAGTTGWRAMRRCEDGGWLLLYASHGGERAWNVRISGDGSSIEVRWRGPIELRDIAVLVEATGIPVALVLRGVPLLHACAVDTGGAAFLVVGASGAGKSTIAAAAVARGNALLTDDIAALETGGDVHVHPGGSELRMNEDTARALGWDPSELRPVFVTPTVPRKVFAPLSTAEGNLCGDARRVAAIFVLGERRPDGPMIARLAPVDAIRVLLRNTYAARAADAQLRAGMLPFWARLAREVPVYAVTPADGLAAVPSLVDMLTAAAATGRPDTVRA